MSELFSNLYRAIPSEIPVVASHMWNSMSAIAGGMNNVVDMMFDNWPMAFQLTEGARHGVQSPSGYYRFRVMQGFDDKKSLLKPVPEDALSFTGHHIDHELVHNIERDCGERLSRISSKAPRRILLTMGGAGAQRALFNAIIQHCSPLVKNDKATLFVNLGDHSETFDWIKNQLSWDKNLIHLHSSWEDTLQMIDELAGKPAGGIHLFLFDNTFHAVYATNCIMRIADIMITKPSELAFYPIPKIFNARVGGHEKWGAIRSAELGDGTIETLTIEETLRAIDLLVHSDDVLRLYCDRIVKNKSIGIYDGAYKCIELATGRKFDRQMVMKRTQNTQT